MKKEIIKKINKKIEILQEGIVNESAGSVKIISRWGYIVLSLLLIHIAVSAQTPGTNVTFNTPEVSAFNRNIETPVSLYTGVPTIDIPIFEITMKGVSVPISLSYHAGGIRVDQEATWVGLGWNLNYGGEISRKIRGIADEYHYLNTSQGGYNTVDYFMKLPNLGTTPNAANQEARFSRMQDAKYNNDDYMPDEFYYSALGYSGRFMFSQPLNKFVLFPKEDIVVQKKSTQYINRDLYLWNLKLPNGTSIDYGMEGYTSSETKAFGNTNARNSWLIKTVRNNFQDSIVYNYERFNYYSTKLSGQYCKFDTRAGYSGNTNFSDINLSDCRLKSITFPGGHVEFTTIAREDMPTRALSKIRVYDLSNILVKEIELIYGYFVGSDYDILGIVNPILSRNMPANYRYKRLKLEALKVNVPGEESKMYTFDYNILDKMPSKYSFSQDHYGFYNGINNNKLYGFIPTMDNFYQGGDRRVKPEASKAFSLKSITYPERGKTEFVYEANSSGISNIPDNILSNYQDDNFVEKYAAISVSSYSHTTSYPQPNETVNGKRYFKKRFSIAGAGYTNFSKNWSVSTNFGLSSYATTMPNYANNVEFILERISTDNSRSVVRKFNTTDMNSSSSTPARSGQDEYMVPLFAGDYEMTVVITFLGQPNTIVDNQPYNLSFFVNWREMDANVRAVNVGGLRVKEIKYFDIDNTLLKKKNYTYTNPYFLPSNPNYTSGQVISFPLYYQKKIRKIDGTVSQSGRTEWAGIIYYSSSSIMPLETTSGSYAGYEYVDEFDIDVKNPSKIFRTNSHFSFDRPYFSEYQNNKMKGLIEPMEWNRGKLLDRSYFRDGKPIRTEKFEYHYMSPHLQSDTGEDYVEEINTDLISFQALNFICGCYTDYPEDFYDTDGGFDNCVYYYYSPFNNYNITYAGHLIISQNAIPSASCNNITKVPYFRRNTGFDKIKSKVTTILDDSANPIIQKEDYLYENTPSHQQLTKTILNTSSNQTVEFGSKYPLDLVLSGDAEIARQAMVNKHQIGLKLVETKRVATTEEISKTDFSFNVNNNQVTPKVIKVNSAPGGAFEDLKQYGKFDNYGNLLEGKTVSGISICYLYSYHNQYPIAEIKNTDYNTLLNALGGEANIQSLSNLMPTDDEVISVINTLRLSSSLGNAIITGYAYKPLVGISLIIDTKGLMSHFEYDGFQRLKWIKDQNGNIVKSYSYNYGEVSAIPPTQNITFSNTVQNQVFTKNDCASGTGSQVTYTVAAGTYTSTISQADADSQAQANINANGQAYANANGSCSSTVAACTNYKITVPFADSNNLYITYRPCGSSTYVTVAFSNMDQELQADDSTAVYICIPGTYADFQFRYGTDSPAQVVNSIQVTSIGNCQ